MIRGSFGWGGEGGGISTPADQLSADRLPHFPSMGSCAAALWGRRERGKKEGRRARGSEGGSVWVMLALDR